MQILIDDEQEICKSSADLFSICHAKFKSLHNKTILLLQYCKLCREENESADGWMCCLRNKANECNYTEHYSWLQEQFMIGLNDEMMTVKMISADHSKEDKLHCKQTRAQLGKTNRSKGSPESNGNNHPRKQRL